MAVITPLHLDHLFRIEVIDALQTLPVKLHVMHFALGIDQLVGVYAITVHFPVTGRSPRIGIQFGQGTGSFRYMGEEIETA
ncbi:hypothetical protein D3C73_1557640 [compost metagenome]